MRKRLTTVSMMLLLMGASAGAAYAVATPGVQGVNITQQNGTCTGVVNDQFGPVIGATVMVKGTTNGAITDLDGKFSLTGVKQGDIIQAFVGYKTQEISWDGKPMNVTLAEDNEVLDEVVVTAYGGKQLRSKVTNSISTVKEDVLKTGSHTNAAQALSGAVSGLRVQQTSGNPGEVPTMVLRGGTNLDGSGSPLIIVDGQVRSSLGDINSEDIESMEVMKDAGATAIYGARANNGVVLIKTKRGKEGFSEIRFKTKIGINQFRSNYKYLDAGDYLYWFRKAVQNSAQFVQVDGKYYGSTDMSSLGAAQPYGTGNVYFESDGSVADGNKNGNAVWSTMKYTDNLAFLLDKGWKTMVDPVYGDKLIYKDFSMADTNIDDNALNQDYNLSLTGGNEKGNYYMNLGFNDTKGNAKGNWYKRFSATLNADYKIRKWLKSESSVSYTRSAWFDLYDGNGINTKMDFANYFSRALSLPPTFRGKNENGDYLYGLRWDYSDTISDNNLSQYSRDNVSDKLNLSQAFVFDIMEGLELKVSGTLYRFETSNDSFNRDLFPRMGTVNSTHEAYAMKDLYTEQTYNAVLNYNKQLTDEHYVSAMLGAEYYDQYRTGFDAYGYGAPTDEFGDLALTQPEGRQIDSWHQRQRILSFFGRLNYDYMSKYLISFVMRRDGYSKLRDNRWGVFPGVSAGWVFGKEKFMESLQDIVSFAKLRTSYGLNGNVSGVGVYDLQGSYKSNKYAGQIGNLIGMNGQYPNWLEGLPNPTLRWEKSHTFEVGVDLGFLNNKYMLNATFYNRRTMDKFASIFLPSHSGTDRMRTNNGEIQNQGLELDLTARVIDQKDWKFNVNANLAWNKNKIISLPFNGQPNNRQDVFQVYDGKSKDGKIWVGGMQEGGSWGDIYGFKAEGIYRDWDDVKNYGIKRDVSSPNNGGRQITLLSPDEWNNLKDEDKKNTGAGGFLPIQPGDVKWKDVNGDGIIDDFDKVKLGNRLPKVTGGITLNLSWKDLSLNTRMDYALGHTVIDTKTPWIMGGAQGSYNTIDLSKDTWTPENPNAKYPTYVWADQFGKRNYCRNNNSLFIYKGDYLAFREVTLSYKVPEIFIGKAGLKTCELSMTVQNLGYLTAAKTMFSPEYGANEWGGYSLPRSIVFGLNVSF